MQYIGEDNKYLIKSAKVCANWLSNNYYLSVLNKLKLAI